MIPTPAQYLLRFDDLCPTMRRSRWEQYRNLIEEFGVRPILAVVPDNRDKDLDGSPADPEFWAQPASHGGGRRHHRGTWISAPLPQPGKKPARPASKNGICRSRFRDAARVDSRRFQRFCAITA